MISTNHSVIYEKRGTGTKPAPFFHPNTILLAKYFDRFSRIYEYHRIIIIHRISFNSILGLESDEVIDVQIENTIEPGSAINNKEYQKECIEKLTQENEDLTQENEDLTQENEELTKEIARLHELLKEKGINES